ncbi:ATP-dependent RecD-like DNA helicase [Candidatus Fermentibacteria bacterium]|nr:ATP-dependent RecD-like DNA helicase [Candidatus Fermentibacteria bacterium]
MPDRRTEDTQLSIALPSPGESEVAGIIGTIERVVFHNGESGWSVLRVTSEGSLITVVGVTGILAEGETIEASGRWVENPRFGRQFQAETVRVRGPSTLEGMKRYLATCGLPGVRERLAERLVDEFGLQTFDVLSSGSDSIRAVAGIGRKKAARICGAWSAVKAEREVLVELLGLGLGVGVANRVTKEYGNRAPGVVRSNPYEVADRVDGIGFRTADRIAEQVGIEPTSSFRIAAGIVFALKQALDEGHTFLPAEDLVRRSGELLGVEVALISEELENLVGHARLAADGESVYLPSVLQMEIRVAQALAGRSRAVTDFAALSPAEERLLVELDDDQRAAVRRAFTAGVVVVTGGPGTGKTTLVRQVCHVCAARELRVILCAPTGRAARRMAEATGRRASTIHRLLEIDPLTMTFTRNQSNPLKADLVVVDESSMVDLPLMDSLVAALPKRGTLLLVGDADQLPPVGPGAVFKETVASGTVPVSRLTTIHRQALGSLIVINAHRVNRGLLPVEESEGCTQDLFIIKRDEPEALLAAVLELVARRIPGLLKIDPARDIQVLTPMRRGVLGTENLNAQLQALLNPSGLGLTHGDRTLRVGDRVMQVKNDYGKMVFNGELGSIEAVDTEAKQLTISFDGRALLYSTEDLDEISLAYASTVHKAQGSEFPAAVVLLHTQHYVMLRRNLLYTALTRGRDLVVLIGSPRAIAIATRNARADARFSRLAQRLADAMESWK